MKDFRLKLDADPKRTIPWRESTTHIAKTQRLERIAGTA